MELNPTSMEYAEHVAKHDPDAAFALAVMGMDWFLRNYPYIDIYFTTDIPALRHSA